MRHHILFPPILLLSTAAFAQSGPPVDREPIRSTFAVAARSVIDHASALDLRAPADRYNAEYANLKTQRENLAHLAATPREQDLAQAVDDMLFSIQSCRIQAIDGNDIAPCTARTERARAAALDDLARLSH